MASDSATATTAVYDGQEVCFFFFLLLLFTANIAAVCSLVVVLCVQHYNAITLLLQASIYISLHFSSARVP